MRIEREGRKPEREGRKPEREGRKPQREGKGRGYKPSRMTAMKWIGKDRSKMKHGDRYPRVNFRIGDDLLGKIAKEIDRSGMSTSEIAKKALSEYLDRREQLEN